MTLITKHLGVGDTAQKIRDSVEESIFTRKNKEILAIR